MTRVYLVISLDRLEPGTDHDPDRRHVLVAPLAGTNPLRYRVIGGHRRYWQAIADGDDSVNCEITLPLFPLKRRNGPHP